MNRNDKILQHLNQAGVGIEVGPFENPVAPKRNGFNVEIIDHASKAGLLAKYQGQPVKADQIEEVDYVWSGQSYADLTGKKKHYDWIIASHVIEHTPDLIGFINSCDEVLKEGGVLSLVIPDKRYCFDHYRPITSISQIIDSHIEKHKIHTPGAAADYFLNVVSMNGQRAWQSGSVGQFELVHTLESARQNIHNASTHYVDLHAWCFVPHSFRLLIKDLNDLGLIQLKEVGFSTTVGCEFYMTIGRSGQGMELPRLEILNTIEQELNGSIAGTRRSLARRLYEHLF
ncbi:MAG: class I SAM-dependent methyltransferase [Gammaproteobacteria bacterium]